ncbi:MAG: hypothetical protein KC983_03870, partial [Phycisphaerales bacterium]|nr:hypothetical protein [Phycisphaerales bacterium]
SMARHFFSCGIMPSPNLLPSYDEDLRVTEQWQWSGTEYQRTAEAWLRNLDAARAAVMPILEKTYGRGEADRWFHRWRMFFLACAELFGLAEGREWGVVHHRLERVRHRRPIETPSFAGSSIAW